MLLLCLSALLTAQNYTLNFTGTVTDEANLPVEGATIYIDIMPSNTGALTGITQTAADGQYQFSVTLPNNAQTGNYSVSLLNCNGVWYVNTGTFGPNNLEPVNDFVYCGPGTNPTGSCNTQILIDSTNAGVMLTALSYGVAPYTYLWSNGQTTASILWQPNGTNYCVTVTDANGCSSTACLFNPPVSCSVTIQANSSTVGLTAIPTGTAPFSYLWSDGSSGQNLQVNASGQYCVTVTDANGCTATDCHWYNGGGQNPCSVFVTWDSFPAPGTNNILLTAHADGNAPFTYQWSHQNASTPTAPAQGSGTYCVTITDATGCTASECISILIGNNCSVVIQSIQNGLYATASVANANFLWSNGATTSSISPTTAGTYCVTITAGACTATDCYNFQPVTNSGISGYIYHPDSNNVFLVFEGIVELYGLTSNTGTWELVSTTDIQGAPGVLNFYSFGQVAPGQYIIKATLSPNSPYYDDFLPTYYQSTIYWDEATIVQVPSPWLGYYNITLSDGQNLTGGEGQINGTVTEGDGFTSGGAGTRGGAPLAGVSILLLDSEEKPITHTITDDNGNYAFGNLPYGTYKIVVEIVGQEQGERWVTISPENPVVTGIDFEVGENGVVNHIGEQLKGGTFSVSPNPATGLVNIYLDAASAFDAQITLRNLAGQPVLMKKENVAAGSQRIALQLGDLPSGTYFIQITSSKGVVSNKVVKK